ncbi:prepilin-type N-terminal cleavage/methylation domain-containing protein [Bacillus tuaregi]|uniref:prepilin-type N-terminal cleavage/methylation domain-containing protein n=1 Tax=Bacillus tuaregi TaxID=1816695 RepID=UPI000A04B733|nr:prepilin-type N-terminal cleavage/methylation domain-containing protein [Bacillus tuaregi]
MMFKRNQQGITVIELLISLAILSLIGVLIWNVFFQGLDFSSKEITKNRMQQEANIILTHLTKIHQTAEEYKIETNSGKILVTYQEGDQPLQKVAFENSKLTLQIKKLGEQSENQVIEVNPFVSDISLLIHISDIDNPNTKITVNTLLSRLRGGE